MQIRYIKNFITLSEFNDFDKTSKYLNINQQTLIKQIENLEEEVGTKLFIKIKNHFKITYAGKVYKKGAVQLLNIVDLARKRTQSVGNGKEGLIRVGFVSTSVLNGYLPHIISIFHKAMPYYDIDLKNIATYKQLSKIVDQSIDIGIIRTPIDNPQNGFKLYQLQDEDFNFLIPNMFDICSETNDKIDYSLLNKYPIVIYSNDSNRVISSIIKNYLFNHGVHINIAYEVNDTYSLCSLVSSGFGYTIAPRSTSIYKFGNINYYTLDDLPKCGTAVIMNKNEKRASVKLFFDLACSLSSNYFRNFM